MGGNSELPARSARRPLVRWAGAVVIVAAGLYVFPLFRVVPLEPAGTVTADGASRPAAPVFDATAEAAKVWRDRVQPAAATATDVAVVAQLLRRDPAAAVRAHGHRPGLGSAAYFFVRGSGRVVERNRDLIRVAIADGTTVDLVIGPVFGNAVRDGTGLLDVNAYPGLAEFNSLSAAFNRRVEDEVQPGLRERAVMGATVSFAGCAEAPETPPAAEAPVLTVIPVRGEVHGD